MIGCEDFRASHTLQNDYGLTHTDANILERRFSRRWGLPGRNKTILPFDHIEQHHTCYRRANFNGKD
jgi:hypothetical protein